MLNLESLFLLNFESSFFLYLKTLLKFLYESFNFLILNIYTDFNFLGIIIPKS